MSAPSERFFPAAEKRRVYYRKAVDEIQALNGCTASEARAALQHTLVWMRYKMAEQEDVELGHLRIEAREQGPRAVHDNIGSPDRIFLLGRRTRWRIRVSKSWLKKQIKDWM